MKGELLDSEEPRRLEMTLPDSQSSAQNRCSTLRGHRLQANAADPREIQARTARSYDSAVVGLRAGLAAASPVLQVASVQRRFGLPAELVAMRYAASASTVAVVTNGPGSFMTRAALLDAIRAVGVGGGE